MEKLHVCWPFPNPSTRALCERVQSCTCPVREARFKSRFRFKNDDYVSFCVSFVYCSFRSLVSTSASVQLTRRFRFGQAGLVCLLCFEVRTRDHGCVVCCQRMQSSAAAGTVHSYLVFHSSRRLFLFSSASVDTGLHLGFICRRSALQCCAAAACRRAGRHFAMHLVAVGALLSCAECLTNARVSGM